MDLLVLNFSFQLETFSTAMGRYRCLTLLFICGFVRAEMKIVFQRVLPK